MFCLFVADDAQFNDIYEVVDQFSRSGEMSEGGSNKRKSQRCFLTIILVRQNGLQNLASFANAIEISQWIFIG